MFKDLVLAYHGAINGSTKADHKSRVAYLSGRQLAALLWFRVRSYVASVVG
jgi:hypothetical protein